MEPTMIWSLRKPLTWVWRKLVSFIGAWTVKPILRQAHDAHIALRRWQRRWVELVNGVDYKLHTRTSFDEENSAEQWIWIRNSGPAIIDEVQFCVEAKLGRASYQVTLAAYRLRPDRTVRLALSGLPLQDLFVHEHGIFSTYESLHVYPVRVVRDNRVEIYSTDGIGWHPTHDDFLNGGWTRWDGRLYNTKAIAEARRETFLRLAHSLCWRHGLIGMDAATLLRQALCARRYRCVPGALMFACLSCAPVLDLILWTRLLLRIERVAFECDPAMAAATEHVLNKGRGARPTRVLSLDVKELI